MIKTFNVSMPKDLVKQVDLQARSEYRSRSEFLKEAVLQYLSAKNNWLILQNELGKRARQMGLVDEEDVEGLVDDLRK